MCGSFSFVLYFSSLSDEYYDCLVLNLLFFLSEDSLAKNQIKGAMVAWNTKTKGCIQFVKRTNEKAYVSFFKGSGYVFFTCNRN